MFMQEQVLLGGLIISILCYTILHCQTCLASSMARLLNHGFLLVGLFPKAQALHPFWKALNMGPKHMFMWEQVLFGGLIIYTLCYLILHCQTCLPSSISMARLLNNECWLVGLFFPNSYTLFERHWTWNLNMYVYVGTSIIGWCNH